MTLVIEIPATLRDVEKKLLVATLERVAGNKKEAAKHLGLSRSALYAKLRRHGIRAIRSLVLPEAPPPAPETPRAA